MAKKRRAARRRTTRRSARRRRSNPDATVNTLVILVLIVLVLGGLYFYAQNTKKQAFLFPSLTQAITALFSAAPARLTPAPDVTGSIPALPAPKPTPSPNSPAAGGDITLQPTSSLEVLQSATMAAAQPARDK